MPDEKKNFPDPDSSIEALGLFSAGDLKLLSEYEIHRLGDLLGSTKGLSRVALFDLLEDGKEKLRKLLEMLPQDFLLPYRNYSKEYPTGLREEPSVDDNEGE